MMYILYFSTMSMTLIFSFMSHPLSMGLVLLIQVTIISMLTGMMAHNFWFSYILFMIMIGGMLVLFIYMTSVASNEMFLYSNKLTFIVMISIMIMIISMTWDPIASYISMNSIDLSKTNLLVEFSSSLSKYFNFPTNMTMITMIIYLLITLIAVVKITNIKYGPLRQKF